MFLSIGKEKIIKEKNILGIFDVELMKESKEFQKMLQNLKENNCLFYMEEKKEKSFLLVEEKGIKGFFSNLSTASLLKRGI